MCYLQNSKLGVSFTQMSKGAFLMKRKVYALILSMLLVLGITAGSVTVASAADVYTNNILLVTVSSSDGNANFRTGPGMEYGAIQPILNGNSLRITGVTKNYTDGLVWGQTTYNGATGWVSLMLTTVNDVENASQASYDVTVTVPQNIYLRRGPGSEYDELARPYNGQVLRIDRTVVNSFDGRPWGRTNINGVQGWVSLNWTYRNSSAVYNWTKDVIYYNNHYNAVVSSPDGFGNMRLGGGMGYKVVQPIYNNTSLYVTATQQNSTDGLVWGYTYCNGNPGWICMSTLAVTGMDTASTAQYYVAVNIPENIVLRKGPGSEYESLANNIPKGTSLYITQTVINSFDGRPWGRTTYNGVQGWISLDWTIRQ